MIEGTSIDARDRIVIIDRNAGGSVGHHRDWLILLLSSLGDVRPIVLTREPLLLDAGLSSVAESVVIAQPSDDVAAWYSEIFGRLVCDADTDLLLLSGDDALRPLAIELLRDPRLRSATLSIIFFRLLPQPGRWSRTRFVLKLVMAAWIRLASHRARLFSCEIPIGPRPTINRVLGLRRLADSSAAEQADPIGRMHARNQLSVFHGSRFSVLTIGMLSLGKHIDSILNSLDEGLSADVDLVFVGHATDEAADLIVAAAKRDERVRYVLGRVNDDVFARCLEAADVVTALYRYSASSGIVLRALAAGTPVILGGSPALTHATRGVPGVSRLRRVTSRSIANGIHDMRHESNPLAPTRYRSVEHEFPLPIIDFVRQSSN